MVTIALNISNLGTEDVVQGPHKLLYLLLRRHTLHSEHAIYQDSLVEELIRLYW